MRTQHHLISPMVSTLSSSIIRYWQQSTTSTTTTSTPSKIFIMVSLLLALLAQVTLGQWYNIIFYEILFKFSNWFSEYLFLKVLIIWTTTVQWRYVMWSCHCMEFMEEQQCCSASTPVSSLSTVSSGTRMGRSSTGNESQSSGHCIKISWLFVSVICLENLIL